jgi:hypothetical protein
MATIDTSPDERQIATRNSQQLNRCVLLFRRTITLPVIVGTAFIGLTSYVIHVHTPTMQALQSDAMTTVAVAIFAAT